MTTKENNHCLHLFMILQFITTLYLINIYSLQQIIQLFGKSQQKLCYCSNQIFLYLERISAPILFINEDR